MESAFLLTSSLVFTQFSIQISNNFRKSNERRLRCTDVILTNASTYRLSGNLFILNLHFMLNFSELMFLCLILLFVALLLIVTALLIVNLQRRLPVTNGTRCLLLIAHPDDECMFFTPSIIQLLRQHCKFYVLCVSTGKNFCEFNNFLQFSRKCRRVGPFAQRRVI